MCRNALPFLSSFKFQQDKTLGCINGSSTDPAEYIVMKELAAPFHTMRPPRQRTRAQAELLLQEQWVGE